METKGVLVIGFGTDEFPAFYTRKSGLTVPKVQSETDVARIYAEKDRIGVKSAILVANPIPQEYEIEKSIVDKWIDQAVKEASEQGIKGKALTPFLLSRIVEISGGRALSANIELVKNNARVAARIAKAMH